MQIVLGLYIPQRGRVLFDDVPVDEIGLDVVRDNVATVLQHPALFNDTVRNNLSLGRPTDDATLWQALEIAQLADVIRDLNIPEKDAKLIFINSVRKDRDTLLQDGDRLGIFPPVGGG